MGSARALGQPGPSSWPCCGSITPPRSFCLARNSPGPIPTNSARGRENQLTERACDFSKFESVDLVCVHRGISLDCRLVAPYSAATVVSPFRGPAQLSWHPTLCRRDFEFPFRRCRHMGSDFLISARCKSDDRTVY